MMFWSTRRLQKPTNWASTILARALPDREAVLQALVVGGTGVALGICVLVAATFQAKWAFILVLTVLLPFIAMIAGNVRKLLLGIIILDTVFPVDINFRNREWLDQIGGLGGFNISATTLLLGVLYFLWLSELLSRTRRLSPSTIRLSLFSVPYLVFVGLSVVIAHDKKLALREVFLLLQTFLLFVYLVDSIHTRQDVLFVVAMLLIGLVFESVVVLGIRFIGHTVELGPIMARMDIGNRVGGTFGSPNDTAGLLSLLLVPSLSILLTRLGTGYRALSILAFGVGGLALIFTLSRGGWIAFTLSIALFYLLARPGNWLPVRVQVFIVITIAVLFIGFESVIFRRLTADDGGAAESRVALMEVAFQMIEDQPILGVGANNYGSVLEKYRGSFEDSDNFWLYTVHNKYLLLWAEIGIGGLLAFLFFVAFTIQRGWRCWQSKDLVLSPIALGFVAALVGQLAHMMAESYNDRPQVQALWLVAGVVTAMSLIERKT